MTEVTCFAANTSFKFILGAVYIHPGASMQDIGMLLWQGLGPYIHNSQYVPPFVQVDSSIPILLCELANYPFLINQEKLATYAFRAVGPHQRGVAQAISNFQLQDKEMPFS
ncbi:hypothetical protein LAZ67_4003304 [Cordylochernes scorpioides]|uniref:Uncharacterized protein n=1 Tax=Cordylochernes scorpioides TaxID=51811 RepID=A0ABY6KDI8_9ARAC|nr:hypothetical protein LAZ67_4003304 [Cordylochernes scorpioides]